MFIFLAIGIVIIGFVGYDVLMNELTWWLAILAVLIGLGLGYMLGRAGRIRWHETEEKVVSEIDVIGIVAIVLYVLLRIGGAWIFGHFLSGLALSTFTLALLGGALLGRFLGTQHSIKNVLDQRP